MSGDSTETIETIRHSMYMSAERWWWIALSCVVVGAFAALCLVRPILSDGGVAATLTFITSVIAPVLAAFARQRSSEFAGRADLCRRAFLYRDTLGENLSLEERRIVALWPANSPLNRATMEGPYFSSNQDIGPGRLADAIGESAFYTAELAKKVALAGFALVGVVVLIFLSAASALTTLSLDAAAMSDFNAVLGIVAIAMLTLVICEVLMVAMAYSTLSRESEAVFRSASQLLDLADKSVVLAVRLAESYSIALAANLPIPNVAYKWHRERIDRAYKLALSRSAT